MFCGKCGTKNFDDASFCRECGSPLGGAQGTLGYSPDDSFQSVQLSHRNRLVGIAAVVVIGVMTIIVLFALIGGRSYKSTATKFLDAVFEGDARTILSLFPDSISDGTFAEMGYSSSDILETLSEALQYEIDGITRSLGNDWGFLYEVLSAEAVSAKSLRDLKTAYEEYDVTVSAAKTVEVMIAVVTEDFGVSGTVEIPVIKVGRSWYLDAENLDNIFDLDGIFW